MFSYWFSPYLIPEYVFIVLWSSDNLPARVSADYRRTKIWLKFIALLQVGAFPFLTRLALKIPGQVQFLSVMIFNNFQDIEDIFPINMNCSSWIILTKVFWSLFGAFNMHQKCQILVVCSYVKWVTISIFDVVINN